MFQIIRDPGVFAGVIVGEARSFSTF